MKVTYNMFKGRKGKQIYWNIGKHKGKPVSSRWSWVKRWHSIRSKAAFKREKVKRKFLKEFKPHVTVSRNVLFLSWCIPYNNRLGIKKLAKLYRRTQFKEGDHTRFYVGSWWGWCANPKYKCPKQLFVAHRKKDKYKMAREQPMLTKTNFADKFEEYLDGIQFLMYRIYKDEVCERCPSGDIMIEPNNICFQIVRLR